MSKPVKCYLHIKSVEDGEITKRVIPCLFDRHSEKIICSMIPEFNQKDIIESAYVTEDLNDSCDKMRIKICKECLEYIVVDRLDQMRSAECLEAYYVEGCANPDCEVNPA